MGHFVTGVIASPDILGAFTQSRSLPAPVSLPANLALLPLRDRDLDAILPLPITGGVDEFVHLSDQLLALLSGFSARGPVMYFETEYFGGEGAQGAVVFRDGIAIYGPISARIGPINKALALLGVRVQPPARDEFETVGLQRHRSTADWLGIEEEDDDDD
jgi:hypothetical protein